MHNWPLRGSATSSYLRHTKAPSRLPLGTQAVYAFLLGERWLKVGKAGPNSQPRFTTQHCWDKRGEYAREVNPRRSPTRCGAQYLSPAFFLTDPDWRSRLGAP
jgi:hypothetical protein